MGLRIPLSGVRGLILPPTVIPRVDLTQKITLGMTSCFVALSNGLVVDALKPSRFSFNSTGGNFGGKLGTGANFAQFGAVATDDLNWTGATDFSAAAWCCFTSAAQAGYADLIDRTTYASESNNQGWAIQWRPDVGATGWCWLVLGNSPAASYRYIIGTGTSGPGSAFPFSTQPTCVLVRAAGNNSFRDGYVNNVYGGYMDSLHTNVAASANTPLRFGPASNFGAVYISCTWNRITGVDDGNQFYEDPYSFLIFDAPRWRVGTVAAAITNRTVNINQSIKRASYW